MKISRPPENPDTPKKKRRNRSRAPQSARISLLCDRRRSVSSRAQVRDIGMMMSESKTPITDEVEALAALWDDETGEGPDGSAFAGDVVQYLPQWSRLKQCESDLAAAHETARSFRDMHYAALAERDALAARVAEALSAVQDVLEAAYHRCYQSCCGRPGMECCGSPIQTWTADDEHIMETLGPVEKSLRAALSREEKS